MKLTGYNLKNLINLNPNIKFGFDISICLFVVRALTKFNQIQPPQDVFNDLGLILKQTLDGEYYTLSRAYQITIVVHLDLLN